MWQLIKYTKNYHTPSFCIARPVTNTLIVNYVNDEKITYEPYDLYEIYLPYVTNLAPFLIPARRDPPFKYIKTVHHFYLRGEQIVIILYYLEEE